MATTDKTPARTPLKRAYRSAAVDPRLELAATHLPGNAHPATQPYRYPPERDFVEPDWHRLPGYRDVTDAEWMSAKWQRQHTVKNLPELLRVFGD